MKFITRNSPIAVHFGALDTRVLQLKGGPGGWSVRAAETVNGSGTSRHMTAVEALLPRMKDAKLRGKDALVSISGENVAVSLVPVDPHNRGRMQQTLKETALRSITDAEGVTYRYMPLGEEDEAGAQNVREELLLLAVGQSELRRCSTALETLRVQPASLEVSAFPLARTMQAMQTEVEAPWGFLHLGFNHSIFGIMLGGELRFMKPMQLTGERLLKTLEASLSKFDESDPAALADMLNGMEEEQEQQVKVTAETISALNKKAVGHAAELMHTLRMESEALAQEVRACLRHFANRHRGAKLHNLQLAGFGAALPEVENALQNALNLPTEVAKPFTALGIKAPEAVLAEEHLWCIPLGLAIRGYV
ncbi:MAG: pilus assembly protein PilM [Planctomycetes bacterium]|nr:pilus assembly protein PilM [Planctomycetota bacterium]MCP4770339.1 pilus assembly protein PilM [Planctomycetota bacterium]MCP4861911.1 pilus assembly protein PilM [Planctomycetota bacterium]